MIDRVEGAGNSKTKIEYTFLDKRALYGTAYYQLKQVDFDGTITRSDIVSVVHSNNNRSIYPNPITTGKDVKIKFTSSIDQSIMVKVTDVSGRTVLTNHHATNRGENELVLPTSKLIAGIYMITLACDSFEESTRLVVR